MADILKCLMSHKQNPASEKNNPNQSNFLWCWKSNRQTFLYQTLECPGGNSQANRRNRILEIG